jgi:GTPase SAR1 family protein
VPADDELTILRKRLYQCTELRAEAISKLNRLAWMVDVFAEEDDPILEIVEHISWSGPATATIGLSGASGVGKTTQIFRLIENLRSDEELIGIRVDYEEYSSLSSPPDITDFLLSLAGGIAEEARKLGHLPRDWNSDTTNERIFGLLRRLSFEPEVSAGPVKIKASLRDDESFRRRLRQHLSGQVAQLVKEVREFVSMVVSAIRQSNPKCRGVVLILDSTERLSAPASAEQDMQSAVRNLFIQNGENLEFSDLHCVYLVPPWLPISDGGALRLNVVSFPAVRVSTRNNDDDRRGLSLLDQIVRRRMPDIERLIAPEDLRQLCQLSGGVQRVLFQLLREVAGRARRASSCPVEHSIVHTAIDSIRQDYLAITIEAAPALRRIDGSKSVDGLGEASLAQLGRYFQALVILQVANGEKWYTIHPLMRQRLESVPILET